MAAAGCGGSTHAVTATTVDASVGHGFDEIASTFARHGEPIAIEPDLSGDDFWLAVGHPELPRPFVVLTRPDGETAVYVFRSASDAEAVAAVPRAELVFRPSWRIRHGANVLAITVNDAGPVQAALQELATR